MKTQNTKLNFKKDSVVELNENQLHDINGGSSSAILLTSAACVVAASVVLVSVAIIAAE